MSSHIVKFAGGFANQVFQYCFYLKLCEIYGSETVLADITPEYTQYERNLVLSAMAPETIVAVVAQNTRLNTHDAHHILS